MSQYYPSNLPGVASFSATPTVEVVADEPNQGSLDVRRRSYQSAGTLSVSWIFNGTQFKDFASFYTNNLLDGNRWFYMTLPSALGMQQLIVRFTKPYSLTKNGYNMVSVSAELELHDRMM